MRRKIKKAAVVVTMCWLVSLVVLAGMMAAMGIPDLIDGSVEPGELLLVTAFFFACATGWYLMLMAVCGVVYWIADEIPGVAKQVNAQARSVWPPRWHGEQEAAPPMSDWEPEPPPRA